MRTRKEITEDEKHGIAVACAARGPVLAPAAAKEVPSRKKKMKKKKKKKKTARSRTLLHFTLSPKPKKQGPSLHTRHVFSQLEACPEENTCFSLVVKDKTGELRLNCGGVNRRPPARKPSSSPPQPSCSGGRNKLNLKLCTLENECDSSL